MFEIGSLNEDRRILVSVVPIEAARRYVPPPVGLKAENDWSVPPNKDEKAMIPAKNAVLRAVNIY